jgi:hypothetical protein
VWDGGGQVEESIGENCDMLIRRSWINALQSLSAVRKGGRQGGRGRGRGREGGKGGGRVGGGGLVSLVAID